MGNDFMPHFPALNIRTGGIDKIINAYKSTELKLIEIDRKTSQVKIYWNHFYSFIQKLADKEELFIQNEYKLRSNKKWKFGNTPEMIFYKMETLPLVERETEIYINPFAKDWEKRYYEMIDVNSTEYIKGLAWNITYYAFGCIDWDWYYPSHYPPLLKDLCKQIPPEPQLVEYKKTENNITALEQLCYVLPKSSLYLLPKETRELLPSIWYIEDCSFSWAFCRYFWESHPDLPTIDFDELRQIVRPFKKLKKIDTLN
jgi:5'-3' exoribonuclease 2